MRILITGANGFVGSNLVNFYKDKMDVIPFYRSSLLEEIHSLNPTYIIHCAAEMYNKDKMFESNVVLTYKLLEICKQLPKLKHFVYIGSSSEYGRKPNPIQENNVLEPDSMYEGTKACGSMLTRVYGKTYNFQTSIIRPFSLYGPKDLSQHFIPKLYDSFKENSEIKISKGIHDFIYIDDFINGINTVLHNNTSIGEIFHFGTGTQLTNLEVYKTFSKILNKNINYTLTQDTKTTSAGIDSDSWVADISKVKQWFNWEPKYNFEQGLTQYINYKNTNG
jgi:nucleoside-diphosphate-sugar epimerase